ncbi:MAG: hypothetical protein ACREWI_12865 [Telluria sp.]
MIKVFNLIVGALIANVALPALAGPDWQMIEQARKAKIVKLQEEAKLRAQLADCDKQRRLREGKEVRDKAPSGSVPEPDAAK